MMVRPTINVFAVSLVFALSFIVSGCYYDNEQELYPYSNCDTSQVTYSLVVLPIVQNNCYMCHSNAQAPTAGNNISLEGHSNLSTYISSNQAIFIQAIDHTGSASPMPKNGAPLNPCDIKKLKRWINLNMPNN